MKSCKNDIIVPMMSMKIWVTYIYLHGLFTEFQLTGSSGIFTGFFFLEKEVSLLLYFKKQKQTFQFSVLARPP